MAYDPVVSSIVVFQKDPTKLVGSVSVFGVMPGITSSMLGKEEDSPHASGDVGIEVLAVRKDSSAALAGADGDYIPLTTNNSGKLWTITDAVQSGAWTVNIGGVNTVNLANSSVLVYVPGSVAVAILNQPSPSIIAYQAAGSIMAVSATVNTGNSSVQLLGGVAPIGSVAVLQGTNPWQVNVPTPSYISYQAAGSVMAVSATVNTGNSSVQLLNMPSPSVIAYQLAGSVMAVSATVNTGNSSVQLLTGVGVIGSVAVLQGTDPWKVNVPTPSYISYQLAGSVMAVAATVNTGNSSVQLLAGVAPIGSVAVLQGTNPWQINMPSPSMISYQAAGSIMAVSATVNTGNSSVQLLTGVAVIGSVATLQGTNPWIVSAPTPSYLSIQPGGSVLNANISGSVAAVINNSSVLAFQGTLPWVIQSIVGTYAEDAASATGNSGLYVLGVRNDTIASTVSADGDYTQLSTDSAGRAVIKPFVSTDATLISYNGSVTSASVTLIQASVAGKRSYITDFWVANSGANTTIVQFRENTTSVIGTTIAPTGGGSNSPGMAIPIQTSMVTMDLSFTGLTATSILYLTVKGYLAP